MICCLDGKKYLRSQLNVNHWGEFQKKAQYFEHKYFEEILYASELYPNGMGLKIPLFFQLFQLFALSWCTASVSHLLDQWQQTSKQHSVLPKTSRIKFWILSQKDMSRMVKTKWIVCLFDNKRQTNIQTFSVVNHFMISLLVASCTFKRLPFNKKVTIPNFVAPPAPTSRFLWCFCKGTWFGSRHRFFKRMPSHLHTSCMSMKRAREKVSPKKLTTSASESLEAKGTTLALAGLGIGQEAFRSKGGIFVATNFTKANKETEANFPHPQAANYGQ